MMPNDKCWLSLGDRVHVAGGNLSADGTVTGFAKDDPTVPWITLDNGQQWDARDLGSVRLTNPTLPTPPSGETEMSYNAASTVSVPLLEATDALEKGEDAKT